MTKARWEELTRGTNCPFCAPRPSENQFWSLVTTLSVSSLYLHKIQTYRGYAVLIFDPRHVNRLSELSSPECASYCNDLHVAQRAIEQTMKPDHVNVAALGNQISHLHWHIIPRYESDPRWGGPIWTTTEQEMDLVYLSDPEHRKLATEIRAAIPS